MSLAFDLSSRSHPLAVQARQPQEILGVEF